MPVIQLGSINATALTVPNSYTQIIPPAPLINGLSTNKLGIVGTGSWGLVNAQTAVGSMVQQQQLFGPIQAQKYDLGTAVEAALMQGANNICCIRVTDGTDVAATGVLADISSTTGLTLTALYTGTVGNTVSVTLGQGASYTTAVKTYRITVSLPGGVPEIYDNIGGTGAAFWQNAANAINLGVSGIRGPSKIVIAAIASSTAVPALATVVLASGTNGSTTITGTVLIGSDTAPRTGMYALRNSGCSVAMLADDDTSTTYAAQVAYGLSEGTYMIMVAPAGTAYATTATALQTAGVDSFSAKCLIGDWCYFNDTTNNQIRLISPQGFVAGCIAALPPQFSSLNQQLQGIVATQTSQSNLVYTNADLAAISLARLDVITNPVPGGFYFGARFGRNCSSNAVINMDNYPRMTNYLAYSIDAVMGQFVGKLNTPTVRAQARATLNSFLQAMVTANQINSFSVYIGEPTDSNTNNPQSQIALGYLVADANVQYASIIEYFVTNLQGGQSVTTSVQVQPSV